MRNSGRYAFMVKKEWRKESISCLEARSKRGNTGRSLQESEGLMESPFPPFIRKEESHAARDSIGSQTAFQKVFGR